MYKWRGLSITKINPARSVYMDIERRTKKLVGYNRLSNENATKLTDLLVKRVNRLRKKEGLHPVLTPKVVFTKGRSCCSWEQNEFKVVNQPTVSTVVHELSHSMHMVEALNWMIPTAEKGSNLFDCHGDRFVRYMTTLGDIMVKQKSFDKFMVKC